MTATVDQGAGETEAHQNRFARWARPALGLAVPLALALSWEIAVRLGFSNGRLVEKPRAGQTVQRAARVAATRPYRYTDVQAADLRLPDAGQKGGPLNLEQGPDNQDYCRKLFAALTEGPAKADERQQKDTGDKQDYLHYLHLVEPMVMPGGVIIAHNVRDLRSLMEDFISAIKRDPRLNHIAWSEPTERIRNVVRALAPPLPGAYSTAGEAVVTFVEVAASRADRSVA